MCREGHEAHQGGVSGAGAGAGFPHCEAEHIPGRLIPLPRELSAGCGLASVSYTHLDVYKRQKEYPTEEEIKEYLAGNLCRCSGYEGQLRGIQNFLAWKKAKQEGAE